MTTEQAKWWQTATGYQIYPRSFYDANGDGIGDIPGITQKLPHLADLGIGFIWLSPVYASPMRDNGYDISDYYDVAPVFGTMADFDTMLATAHRLDIRIVMDLVVNHCSSDHPWFTAACATADCPEHEYFYWRPAKPDGSPPDDQRACFGGSAWHWVETVQKYCYCHFGPQQPDLNWQNPDLRAAVYKMMNWWLDKGVDGFRMDVIDLIGKDIDKRHYFEGPDMHAYLREMHRECLAGRDVVTVGETWSATPDSAIDYSGRDRDELSMVFNFNHVQAAWDPQLGRFGPNTFNLVTHKMIMNDWQQALAKDGWNSLYLSNHDLPRPVSHYADDTTHRVRAAKMLAMVHYLMKGTPYIYQGEEIGMTNVTFTELDQFRDIETLGQLTERLGPEGSNSRNEVSVREFLDTANTNGRDNARTPVQWTAGRHAGFTNGDPWIDVNPNHTRINVEQDRSDPNGVFAFYQRLIRLRKEEPIISQGSFELLLPDDPNIFAYKRHWNDQTMTVFCNFGGEVAPFNPIKLALPAGEPVLQTVDLDNPVHDRAFLHPFEGYAWIERRGGA